MIPDVVIVLIGYAALLLDIIAVLVVFYGSMQAFVRVLKIEFGKKAKKFREYENAKRVMAQKLIFGLDFFIAADLLKIVANPTAEELYLIALIVAIRTVLSYFLGREIHLHDD